MQIIIVLNILYNNQIIQTENFNWISSINEKQLKEFKVLCYCLSMIGFIADNVFVKVNADIDDLYELISVDLAYLHSLAKKKLSLQTKYYNPKILIDDIEHLEKLSVTPHAFLIKNEDEILEIIPY